MPREGSVPCARRVLPKSDDPQKAGDSTLRARTPPLSELASRTLATTHSVQCQRTDTTETNWPGQEERSSKKPVSIRRNERKEKTQLPTQTCLPLCTLSGKTQLLARGAQAPLILPPTRKQNNAADPSLFTGRSTRHTQHRRKGSAPN